MTRRVIIPGVILGLVVGVSAHLFTRGSGTPYTSPTSDRVQDSKIEPKSKLAATTVPKAEEIKSRHEQATLPVKNLTRPAGVESERQRNREPAPPVPHPLSEIPKKIGTLSVNAQPWAQVRVDGQRKGQTPLELELSAGRHTVVLVYENQRFSRNVTIHVGKVEHLTHDW